MNAFYKPSKFNLMKLLKSILFVLSFAFSSIAFGQYTDVINSNRPGVSQSAFSVGTNVIQLETGPYSIKEKHALQKHEVSGFGIDFAARYGFLFEELELSFIGNYQNDTKTINSSGVPYEQDRANFKHLTLGAKYMIYDPFRNAKEDKPNIYSWKANQKFKWKNLIPAVAIYAGANFDSKNNPYTAPEIEGFSPKVGLISQNNFNNGWVFIINLLQDRIGTDYSDFQYILTLTHSFSPQWVIFAETQGIKSDFYADNLFRFGGAYLLSKDFQLDTALTLNTKDTPSVFSFNFGASYRLDFHTDKPIDNNNSAKQEGKRQERSKKNQKKLDFDDGL